MKRTSSARSAKGDVVDLGQFAKEKERSEQLTNDMAFINRLLSEGYTYTRYLCRDSMGGERPTEKLSISVELTSRGTKESLYAFIIINLQQSKFISGLDRGGEELHNILEKAESKGLIKTDVKSKD